MTEPLSAVMTVAPATEPPPARPRSPYQHAFWFAVLLATALTLAGASFAVGAYEAAGRPETVVREYFAALADGDAAEALGYGTVPAGPHDLLTADVLAAQNAIGPIGDVTVRGVQESGPDALVDVTYTVGFATGPVTVRDEVSVHRDGGTWRLDQTAIPVMATALGGSAVGTIAGGRVRSGRYVMFPGAVPVTYATPNLRPAPGSSVLRFTDAGNFQFGAVVSPSGRRTILSSLRAALAACLTGRSTAQPLCPVPDSDGDVPGSLRGTVANLDPTEVGMIVESADGEIDIRATALVRATYRSLDPNNIPQSSTATKLTFSAHCYATAPGTIRWDAS